MEDTRIIELYFQRNEQAISETANKYGAFCHSIANNILSSKEDSEECVNDTYNSVWNAIPPLRPNKFKVWLGKIVRNTAINIYNKNDTQKRGSGMAVLLSELEECVPSPRSVENEIAEKELSEIIEKFLRSLEKEDQILFVRRYWNGISLKQLAKGNDISPKKLAQQMYRLRISLKNHLEKEGVSL